MTEKQFIEIVEAVCRRPRMYTVNGTFEEVVCFLDGFGLGSDLATGQTHSIWTNFGKWLANTRGIANGPIMMSEFRGWYENDERALAELIRFYQEYANNSDVGF
ncbi:MAG: hypothetical protein IPN69_18695 [Acidobacteria bacterium]|nr:hypothetical protein [Acidobacteriota bacterium]MBK8146935.1 hypothetical protein [Acidobacteriota bacterium]MBK8812742.1 hypothetical protein [Acidobacteriota bacterium]